MPEIGTDCKVMAECWNKDTHVILFTVDTVAETVWIITFAYLSNDGSQPYVFFNEPDAWRQYRLYRETVLKDVGARVPQDSYERFYEEPKG